MKMDKKKSIFEKINENTPKKGIFENQSLGCSYLHPPIDYTGCS